MTSTPQPLESSPNLESECPGGMFQWSAFGANYPDTYCQNSVLFDADSNRGGDIPCPFCDPNGFTDYAIAGSDTIPTCSKCETQLPNGTPLKFADGPGLSMSAPCPTCGVQDMLWREYDPEAEGFVCWEAAQGSWPEAPSVEDGPVTAQEPSCVATARTNVREGHDSSPGLIEGLLALIDANGTRMVNSVEELEALPEDSVVRTAFGVIREKCDDGEAREPNFYWTTPGSSDDLVTSERIALPAMVLFEPRP